MSTPNELYARIPQGTTRNLDALAGVYFNHLPEAGDGEGWRYLEADRIETRFIAHFNYDHRRFWRLATVWFDGKPIMVIQNAGREGDDHSRRIVTDEDGLVAMARYVRSLVPATAQGHGDFVDPDSHVKGLIEFYGQHLDGPFRRY